MDYALAGVDRQVVSPGLAQGPGPQHAPTMQILESLVLHPKPTTAAGNSVTSAAKHGLSAAAYAQKPLEEPLLAKVQLATEVAGFSQHSIPQGKDHKLVTWMSH